MRKLYLTICAALCIMPCTAQETPQTAEEFARTACTSIMVGKKASTDGSVMTSHTCDSWYRTWMEIVPAADHAEGAQMPIFDGLMHTEYPTDSTGISVKGRIPQVAHTYRFLNTAYPCLNEKQLGIGETTISGRGMLRNKNGMFMIEELERVALQRCSTARDAILLMGQLIKEYGYGDSGECLTIADKNEVWIFEVFGEGPDKIGGVWAAVRIPDDHVSVSANNPRISRLNLKDKANYLASDNVYSVARELGLWDGKKEFRFWEAYGGNNYAGQHKNYYEREYIVLSTVAPSLGLSPDAEELPLSVKPDRQLSPEDVQKLLTTNFEGTIYDMTAPLKVPGKKPEDGGEPEMVISPFANPWMGGSEVALYKALGANMDYHRPVSVAYCAYSTLIQLRSDLPDEIGGVAWIGFDNPGQSPRFPVFSGATKMPAMATICGNHRDRSDAALWHFRKANRLATVTWGKHRSYIEDNMAYFRSKGTRELPWVETTWKTINESSPEEATAFLNGYTADFLAAEIIRWDEIERTLWRALWSGF